MKTYTHDILGTVQAGPISDNLSAVSEQTARFVAKLGGNYWAVRCGTDTLILDQNVFQANGFELEREPA